MSDLIPEGWCITKISDISTKCIQRKPELNESFTYIDIGSINRKLKTIENPQLVMGNEAPSRARKVINKGDVLVSLTRPNLNAVALVTEKLNQQIASTGFEVIRPYKVNSRYLFALSKSKHFIDTISGAVQGALYPAAKSSDVQSYQFPLPPLAEQKVIADKLDELLAQVESTKARLDAIPAILKSFRQSVLSDAVSGKLTKGITLKSKKLSNVASFQNGFAFKSGWFTKSDKWQVIKLGNIRDGHLFIENAPAYVSDDIAKDFLKFSPNKGDTLISMTGTRFKKDYGFGCIVSEEQNILINQRVGRLIPTRSEINPMFLNIFVRSDLFRNQFFQGETGGVNQGNVGSKHIMSILIEVPELAQQTEIVRRVEELFAFANKVEAQVNEAQARVNNLTQSILAKAFRGELTANWRAENPDLISGDNSATALLERIKAEREVLAATKKPAKKASTKKKTLKSANSVKATSKIKLKNVTAEPLSSVESVIANNSAHQPQEIFDLLSATLSLTDVFNEINTLLVENKIEEKTVDGITGFFIKS